MNWFKRKPSNTTKCTNESSTSDCNLVQQLKEKQAEKKQIELAIHDYKSELATIDIPTVVQFLLKLEDGGIVLKHNSRPLFSSTYHETSYNPSEIRTTLSHIGTGKIKAVLVEFNNVDKMCTEIKALQAKANMLADMQKRSMELDDEIDQIKAVLGIE